MITIISGTNRPNSRTKLISSFCYKLLQDHYNGEVEFLDLVDLNLPLLTDSMYDNNGQHPAIVDIQDRVLIPTEHILIVSPEYNGSFPGALKLFIDCVSTRDYKLTFGNKKVSLIGVASGKAGNFRGLEHLTGLLNYLNMLVMPNKLPISSIENFIDDKDELNLELKSILKEYIELLLKFNCENKVRVTI
jgi:NAD(P)H-dependent FMN reductase